MLYGYVILFMAIVSLYVIIGNLCYTNQNRGNAGSVTGILADVLKYQPAIFINVHMSNVSSSIRILIPFNPISTSQVLTRGQIQLLKRPSSTYI
ncbi:hypothetical protein PHMEG_00022458 [Phytophthora megakarya]|uniref:Uncharacterized protein n=1 Tax=Phytophthora megakarya TaxID=4795 RepID=A0A225VJ54_9STRA|nr:hypothetical protein PHMEG_00022458 [Phytophthora megakarya]